MGDGNIDAERICSQCGNRADAGLIFCGKCGAAIQPPSPLIQSSQDVVGSPALSPTKRLGVAIVKGIRGIALVVFILCPFRSRAMVLTFVGSVIVILICHRLLTTLDETYIDKSVKNGYWPQKPIDWKPSATIANASRTKSNDEQRENSYRV
jgi:hypothetical protein